MNDNLFSNLDVTGELGAEPQVLDDAPDEAYINNLQIVIIIGGLGSLTSAAVAEQSLAEVGPNAGLDELLQTRQKANQT